MATFQFRLNGTAIGAEVTAFPWICDWNTTALSDGNYTLTAVARDWVGNTTTSAPIAVTVRNGVLVLSAQDTSLGIDGTNYSTSPLLTTYTWPNFRVAKLRSM